MPEARNIEDARTKEIIELMDKLSDLAGVASFSSQMNQLVDTAKSQRQSIKENTAMTDTEVDALMDQLPNLMAETISQTFNVMTSSMQQVLNNPEKLKEAIKNKTK